MKFPQILYETRLRKGMSQAELANECGIPSSSISHFETGGRAPSFKNLVRLVDSLNVSADFLLGRVERFEKNCGPLTAKLLQNFSKMTSEDQTKLVAMAKIFVTLGGRK